MILSLPNKNMLSISKFPFTDDINHEGDGRDTVITEQNPALHIELSVY